MKRFVSLLIMVCLAVAPACGTVSPAWAVDPTYEQVDTTHTQTLTGKTINAESTGNVITIPVKMWLPGAACDGSTPASIWDLPIPTPAVPVCVTGQTQKAVLQFADTSGGFSAQNLILLPADFTSTMDARIIWYTNATSGNMYWEIWTVCTAVNATSTDDPTYNNVSAATTAAPGTTMRIQTSTITGIDIAGCSAGNLLHIKISRDGDAVGDTISDTANLIGVELTMRRAM